MSTRYFSKCMCLSGDDITQRFYVMKRYHMDFTVICFFDDKTSVCIMRYEFHMYCKVWPNDIFILNLSNPRSQLPFLFIQHVLNYIYKRRVISANKTFYMQKEQNISLRGLYERKARTKSINRGKTPQSLFKKEQNLESRLFLEQQQAIIYMYCYTRKNAITYAA